MCVVRTVIRAPSGPVGKRQVLLTPARVALLHVELMCCYSWYSPMHAWRLCLRLACPCSPDRCFPNQRAAMASLRCFSMFILFAAISAASVLARGPDATSRGKDAALWLRKQLDDIGKDSGSDAGEVVEPIIDASVVAEAEGGIRKTLFSASSHFNIAASGSDTIDEQRIHERLRDAMRSPSVPGHPEGAKTRAAIAPCAPDFSRCPVGWSGPGPSCIAPSVYAGPCASRLDFTGLGDEQKFAIARYCGLMFACSNGV